MTADLSRLAMTVLQPGYAGASLPDWMRGALDQGLGGVVLFARNHPLDRAARQIRERRPDAIVAVDEEGGTITRFEVDTGSSVPGNRALGVVDDVKLTERVGRHLGRMLARAGVTLDYAPTADVNANPANPVIGVRSFGPDPALVARHTAAYVAGVQGAGVAACAKHFPGHGDTITDSHLALPAVRASRDLLTERDLPPFRAAVEAGVRSIMCGHLLVPALDPDLPATLSRAVLTDLLRGELGFDGMLVTDAIEMRAVAALFDPGEIAVRALAAGADAVCAGLVTEDGLYAMRDALVQAVRDGRLPEERLAEAAARVRAVSAWHAGQAGLRDRALAEPDDPAGLEAARAALTVTGSGRLTGPPLVVEVNTRHSQAVDQDNPSGVTAALSAVLPGTRRVPLEPGGALPPLGTGPAVLVVHDAARHAWVRERVAQAVRERPDVIVIDTGIPAEPTGAAHLATHGISRVSAQAAAEWLVS
ncbi:glycoside hydrolase family 3 protein [Nonomuraea sp. MCN248]|uniref:Glycoside hydrolase family 3 protein n=1 Tax=Nonomuraea corallina TaxID=2989783 RepID=A0ABT4SG61_9ACTN|nr:glycoside hydrolase family 3 N-terminal domain-containing protein [Nonomuraea corallina]MDA0636018.1 glycoside hydrolase family 3 protein [Nonomuraea corallina]